MRVREVRRERLGAGEGGVRGRLEVRLRGDAGLVGGRQVELAHVDRVQLGVGEGARGEDWRPVGEVGVRQEGGEGGREHLREVGRGRQVLGGVLLHVDSLPVRRRVHLQIRRRPGVRVRAVSPFLWECLWQRPCVGLAGVSLYIHGRRLLRPCV